MHSLTLGRKIAFVSFAVAALCTATETQAQVVKPPPPGPLRPYTFPKVEQFTLDNGLKVVVVEKHTLPVVEGRLMLDAGALREPANKNGLASLTGRLLTEGTGDLTGAEFSRRMECLGAQKCPLAAECFSELARQNAAELAALPDMPAADHIAAFARCARSYARRLPPIWDLPRSHGSTACATQVDWPQCAVASRTSASLGSGVPR